MTTKVLALASFFSDPSGKSAFLLKTNLIRNYLYGVVIENFRVKKRRPGLLVPLRSQCNFKKTSSGFLHP